METQRPLGLVPVYVYDNKTTKERSLKPTTYVKVSQMHKI